MVSKRFDQYVFFIIVLLMGTYNLNFKNNYYCPPLILLEIKCNCKQFGLFDFRVTSLICCAANIAIVNYIPVI